MKNTLRLVVALLFVMASVTNADAQYIDSEADVQIDAPSTAGDWNKTYNAGLAGEVKLAPKDASVSSGNSCDNNAGGKKEILRLSSSDSQWLDAEVPSTGNSTMAHLRLNLVGNNSGGPWTEYVWTSTSSPFDATKAKQIAISFSGYGSACSEIDVDLGSDVKSIRLYRRVKVKDNGDGTFCLACSDSKTNTGSGQTYGIFKFYLWLNKGPEIKKFKVFGQEGTVSGDNIIVDVPFATDITGATVPDEITLSPGASFTGTNNATTAVNFSETIPVVYDLKDGDGNTKSYNVLINRLPASTTKTLTDVSFDIDGEARTATISGNTVTLKLPFSYSDGKPNANKRKTVQTTFTYSDDLASAALSNSTSVTSGTALTVDYTAVTSITVTAEDGSPNKYNFAIEYEPASTACDLLALELPLNAGGSVAATIDQVARTATATMTTANFNSSMVPTVTTSPLSTYSTSSTNYSSPVTFTVTAEDGTTSKEYVLTIYKDDTKPTVTITSPADGAEGVSLAGKINLTFTETDNSGNPGIVKLGTGKVHITGGSIDQDLTAVMTGDNTATVAFSGLESLTTYTLTIATDAFTDNVGNKLAAAVTSTFKTADGTLHTVDLPYISKMDADNFAQPAFITGNYDATVSTMGATTDQFGAYKLAPGESLTLTAESAGTLDAIIYAKAAGSYSISDGTQTITGSFSSYDNNGNEESLVINSSTTTTITITNTGSTTDIYVPYISVSADGTAITEKAAHCN
ncbi:MAG: Ig-like domain-containing protein [Paludibacteraceae bacterium]|nr:Ig-like domain-containing protein [Paludibacteraceae bacterium]